MTEPLSGAVQDLPPTLRRHSMRATSSELSYCVHGTARNSFRWNYHKHDVDQIMRRLLEGLSRCLLCMEIGFWAWTSIIVSQLSTGEFMTVLYALTVGADSHQGAE